MPTAERDLAILSAVSIDFVQACEAIAEDDWTRGTPCAEWNLAQLIDHVTGGNWFTSHLLDGERADEALAEARSSFAGGHASKADAISAMEEMTTSFNGPGALTRSIDHVVGPLTGHQALRLRLQDLIIHTWDIKQTIDPPASLPPSFVEWGHEELRRSDSLTAKHFGAVRIDSEVESENGEARYLAAFGR